MRKFMLILMAVALIAGCVSTGSTQKVKQGQQRGTAEIIERDGGAWVHVLGTGIVFPLLGAWEEVEMAEGKSKQGMDKAIFTAKMQDGSIAILEVSQGLKPDMTLMDVLMDRWYTTQEASSSFCRTANAEVAESTMISDEVFYTRCTTSTNPRNGERHSISLAKGTKDDPLILMTFIAWGKAYDVYGKDAEEMLRQVETNQ